MVDQAQAADEISLVDIWRFARRYWRVLLGVPVLAAALAVLVALALPNRYAAGSLLLVPAPLGPQGGIEVLKSEPVLQKTVDRFQLAQRYQAKDAREAKLALLAKLETKATKEGLLDVDVTDLEPAKAAEIANFLVATAREQMLNQHVTEHSKNLYNLRGRLGVAQLRLDEAARRVAGNLPGGERALSDASVQLLSNFATLDAQMTVKGENSLSTLQSSILQMRSDLERANEQIRALPQNQLEALRNLYFNRAMLRELQKQIELEQVLAAQDVQVVLPASPPLEKSGPKRGLIVVLSTLAGLMLAVLGGLAHQMLGRFRQEVRQKEASPARQA